MKWLRREVEKPSKPSIEQQQLAELTQLGNKLGSLRQEQGLSLDEIVMMTKIPRRLLQAIETGDLNDLPEPIYIQGLIRQFADALGLKGSELVSNFPLGLQRVNLRGWEPQPVSQLRPFHLYVLYIFLIICSVNGLSQLLNKASLQASNNLYQPKVERTSDATLEEKDVEIGVTLKSSSWIRVVADGKTEFEGVLPEGSYRNWKASEELTVKTNNAGGVLMSVNQKQPQQMGKIGKVEEVRIAAKSR